MRIGIDLMGSDSSPETLYEAIEKISREVPEATLIVFVNQAALDKIYSLPNSINPFNLNCSSRIEFQIVSEIIEMNDDPIESFRLKKDSSIVIGLKLLKKNFLDAFVSAGNTGALITGATLSLSLLPEIKRPALLTSIPTENGNLTLLDVGGNVSCKSINLIQFARMGIYYQRCQEGTLRPRFGLLNIGEESKKGTGELRQAYQYFSEYADHPAMQFVGNVEAKDIFKGNVDVLITDGFTGNVLLKTSEGVASFIFNQTAQILKNYPDELKSDILSRINAGFNFKQYSGAIICGVDRIIVKCHGHAAPDELFHAIMKAIKLVKNQFIASMKRESESFLSNG